MLTIRIASAADAAAIEEVRVRSWRAAYAGLLPQGQIDRATGPGAVEQRRQRFAAEPDTRTLLAERDGAPVGTAAYGPERDHSTEAPADRAGPPAGELYMLYVVPEQWSTGTGRELLLKVIGDLREDGYAAVSLWVLEANERARRFYERAGFTVTGRQVHERHGRLTREVRYERAL